MSEGNFCRLRSFSWLFRLIRNSYGLIGLVEGSRKWSGRSFIKDSRRRFVVFMLKFSRNPVFLNNNCSNIWVIKSEKQNLYKNRWQVSTKLRISQTHRLVKQNFFSLSRALEISFEELFYRKKQLGAERVLGATYKWSQPSGFHVLQSK